MVAQQAHRFQDQFKTAMERPQELVTEYPMSSMLVMFGVGLGVGVVVGQVLYSALAEMTPEPTMSDKMKQQAYDAISHVLPASMLKQLQSYTHS